MLQHLPNIGSVLDHVAKITKVGGSGLIIDAHDATRFFRPSLSSFMDFFAAYVKNEAKGGRDRNVGSVLTRNLESNPSWRMGSTLQLLIPSTIPGNLELMRRNYALLIELVEEVGNLEYDFEKLKEEWRWWCGLDKTYTQVGLCLSRIDRI